MTVVLMISNRTREDINFVLQKKGGGGGGGGKFLIIPADIGEYSYKDIYGS
jgi:hypothetical protein